MPSRTPPQRLAKLVQFSEEILNGWFDELASKERWIAKFSSNADRMASAYDKCGFYDPSLPDGGPRQRRDIGDDDDLRYNQNDPRDAVKQITTGFRKWAERYIADCSGHRREQHQIKRMEKWNQLLQAHLDRIYTE